MSDEDALLNAVAAEPDDDLPRLVYADWLDERDRGKQAAFIRGQIRTAKAGPWDREGKAKFQAIPLPRGAVIRPATVRTLIAVRPWNQMFLDPRTPLVVVSGGRDCRRCVGWLRGFPTLVACSPRTWHEVHGLIRGPIDLYLTGREGMLWGSLPNGRSQSLVDPGVQVPDAHTFRYDLAFPNVRSHNGACGRRALNRYYDRWCEGWSDRNSDPAAA